MLIFFVFSLLIALLAVIFAVQNTAQVTVAFLFWDIKGSLALILLVTLIAGILIAYLATLPAQIRDKWNLRGHRKKLNEMEASLTVHKKKLEEVQNQLADQEQQRLAALKPPAEPGETDSPKM